MCSGYFLNPEASWRENKKPAGLTSGFGKELSVRSQAPPRVATRLAGFIFDQIAATGAATGRTIIDIHEVEEHENIVPRNLPLTVENVNEEIFTDGAYRSRWKFFVAGFGS